MSKWIKCRDALPELKDNSVLAYFDHGGIDMVHIQDYFGDITAGVDDTNGRQLYTKFYIRQGVTHWMPLPLPPEDA